MEEIFYECAIYKINQRKTSDKKEILTKISMKEYPCKILPKEITMDEMIQILVNMQQVCFKEEDNEGNKSRLKELFLGENDQTIAIALCLGYKYKNDKLLDYVDAASATLQKHNHGFLQYQQPTINEVCRHKVEKLDSLGSPTNNIMNILELYIRGTLMHSNKHFDGMYLYVEKNPEHGSGEFLLKYYGNKYGFQEMKEKEDNEYYYMKKPLQAIPKVPKTKKKRVRSPSKSPNKGGTRKVYKF